MLWKILFLFYVLTYFFILFFAISAPCCLLEHNLCTFMVNSARSDAMLLLLSRHHNFVHISFAVCWRLLRGRHDSAFHIARYRKQNTWRSSLRNGFCCHRKCCENNHSHKWSDSWAWPHLRRRALMLCIEFVQPLQQPFNLTDFAHNSLIRNLIHSIMICMWSIKLNKL